MDGWDHYAQPAVTRLSGSGRGGSTDFAAQCAVLLSLLNLTVIQ